MRAAAVVADLTLQGRRDREAREAAAQVGHLATDRELPVLQILAVAVVVVSLILVLTVAVALAVPAS
jgi:hypothetical protein